MADVSVGNVSVVNPKLSYGLVFDDLYSPSGLQRLDTSFLDFIRQIDEPLARLLLAARSEPSDITPKDESGLLLDLAPHVDDFVGSLFNIAVEVSALQVRHSDLAPLYSVKRNFVQRRSLRGVQPDAVSKIDGETLSCQLEAWFGESLTEISFARHVSEWEADPVASADKLAAARDYAVWAALSSQGQEKHRSGVLFKQPRKLDPANLVRHINTDASSGYSRHTMEPDFERQRDGFGLTDMGATLEVALDEANYCIWCHNQGKDSCSKGLREKPRKDQDSAHLPFRKSSFGVPLTGCPLEEKISEFHTAKVAGWSIGALAIIIIDNPMVAATGHRICNDCMKACIFQKQEPVNIPQVETRTLKDVLDLPYGFEIYSLLTRWNPLNLRRPLPRPSTGRKVLVAGMGPAGVTIAHHLMNDGHALVGIDGLKIEPLPSNISGVSPNGRRVRFRAIREVAELFEDLDERVGAGFGGVMEYGITVRWNKNFLKLVRLLLERRAEFALFGGVRFGGTITADDAFNMGFDHIVVATGAGRPTILELPNGLARGVRTASDFLMALQLTGAAKGYSLANLQIRLPIVVIGGGLTAIDAATESLAYYPVQVEKFLARYEILTVDKGESLVRAHFDSEELEVADEFLTHARALRAERALAQREKRKPQLKKLLRSWGGATIAYRKRLIESPSYTLNHEEVEKALEEGISFAEELRPVAVEVDGTGHAKGLRVEAKNGEILLPARTILVAAGTQPNTVLAREDSHNFELDGRYFRACDEHGTPVRPEHANAKPSEVHVLLSRRSDGRFMSFLGDVHPSFFGNVVKAMGGAKQGYPVVTRLLLQRPPTTAQAPPAFFETLNFELRPTVVKVENLTPTIIEVTMRAPRAARAFRPGQFYRLQNFESFAESPARTKLAMEGLALTGASCDRELGLLSTIVLRTGGSSDLCSLLQPGEPVVLMGPTGTPTEIEADETVALIGGGLGNAVLFSIGQALRAKGSRVIYFAGYKTLADRFKIAEIEAAADVIVWCCDESPGFVPTRSQDFSFVGNIVKAMAAYAKGDLGSTAIQMDDIDRIIVIGSDRMMAAVAYARHTFLSSYLKANHFAIGSINSPMQCMMKEICAQCLQAHRDPTTGKMTYVFSCFNQDQRLDCVDWGALSERLKQNSPQEKLTALWINHCLEGSANR